MRRAALSASLFSLAMAPAMAGDFTLGLPIDCTLGTDCRIQQYVDRDPGPGAADFTCGRLSYDGHKGTDFALSTRRDMARGVAVLAAAAGVVQAVRDGMSDTAYSADRAEEIDGRDCGNGVLLRHEDGWETQYCHFRQGSVRVQPGDRLERGDALGLVGLSGRTQFPHVHLSVRRDGEVVDPFASEKRDVCGTDSETLWSDPPDYAPGGMIQAGFAPDIPSYDAVRAGDAARDALPPDAPALVVYAYAFGGQAGDRVDLRITGPNGVVFDQSQTLDKDQALFFRAGGKRRPGAGWPTGDYTGTARLIRDGRALGARSTSLRIE